MISVARCAIAVGGHTTLPSRRYTACFYMLRDLASVVPTSTHNRRPCGTSTATSSRPSRLRPRQPSMTTMTRETQTFTLPTRLSFNFAHSRSLRSIVHQGRAKSPVRSTHWKSIEVVLRPTCVPAGSVTVLAVVLDELEPCLLGRGGRLIRAEGHIGPSASS